MNILKSSSTQEQKLKNLQKKSENAISSFIRFTTLLSAANLEIEKMKKANNEEIKELLSFNQTLDEQSSVNSKIISKINNLLDIV